MLELCVHRTVDGRILGFCDWLVSHWRLPISTGSRQLVTDIIQGAAESFQR